ncbi:MAG: DUF3078 domain-containing protein [Chitinophagia bacterium]|nr:DUF3078 domain-containing protein [Chitinophagia bacterium]
MRKVLFLTFVSLLKMAAVQSQDLVVTKLRTETSRAIKKEEDTTKWNWKRGGVLNLNLAQGSLNNWAAGGDNFSMTLNGYFNYYSYFKKDRHNWDNNLDINLGYVQTTSAGSRKNDDRFDFLSKYGYKMDSTGKWFSSALFNFRSQFFDGYTYSGTEGTFASTILSPAYIILSAGFDYKLNDKFSMFISPITSRTTLVMNKYLAEKGLYGVKDGNKVLYQVGTFATFNYNNTFSKNIIYKARLDLFSNYQSNPGNIDIFMTNQLTIKVAKNFSATYSLDMIYDDDVRLFGPNKTSPGLQVKSLIGLGYIKSLSVKRRLITETK